MTHDSLPSDRMDVDSSTPSSNDAEKSTVPQQSSPGSPSLMVQSTPITTPVSAATSAATAPNNISEKTTGQSELTTRIYASLKQSFLDIRQELETAHVVGNQVDHLSIAYQQKLADARAHIEQSAQAESGKEDSENTISSLRTDLTAANAELTKLRDEKQSLLERLANRDSTISAHTNELTQLRPNAALLPSLRQQLATAETERDAAVARLQQEERLRQSRDDMAENNVRVLNEQVVSLTAELTTARCNADAAQTSSADAVHGALAKAKSAEKELQSLSEDKQRMQQYIDKLQSDLRTKCDAADELTKSYKQELAELNKIVSLHEERSQEAEQRAREYEEALAQEKELAQKRAEEEPPSRSLEPHFQVMFKTVEKGLNSRLQLLEMQNKEMGRARDAEMQMRVKQSKLEREAKDARFEAELARKEVLRQNRHLEAQGEEITRLKRQMDITGHSRTDKYISTPSVRVSMEDVPTGPTHGHTPSMFRGMGDAARQSDAAMDIGPATVIPTHYDATPSHQRTADPTMENAHPTFNSTMREMSEIRRRHEQLLQNLTSNRISFTE